MKTDVISQSSLFNGLPPEHLEKIRNIGIEKSYRKGENIFTEGDEGSGFYLVSQHYVK